MQLTMIGKKTIAILFGIVALVGLIFVLSSVFTKETNAFVKAGDTVIVSVSTGKIDDLYGYEFKVNYDADAFEYQDEISKINDIDMIFSKPFLGYQLVGATMIGERQGISGKNKVVCEMEFTALGDQKVSKETFSLSAINVVKSDLQYESDLTDWGYQVTVRQPTAHI